MAAALKSSVPYPGEQRQVQSQSAAKQGSQSAAQRQRSQGGQVVAFGAASPAPTPLKQTPSLAVRVLSALNQVTSVGMVLGVVMVLAGYGYSVHISRQLSHSEQQLSQLQRKELQLTTANEVLKSHLADQVESVNAGLAPPRLGNVIFLQPAPTRTTQGAMADPAPAATSVQRQPLGY